MDFAVPSPVWPSICLWSDHLGWCILFSHPSGKPTTTVIVVIDNSNALRRNWRQQYPKPVTSRAARKRMQIWAQLCLKELRLHCAYRFTHHYKHLNDDAYVSPRITWLVLDCTLTGLDELVPIVKSSQWQCGPLAKGLRLSKYGVRGLLQ